MSTYLARLEEKIRRLKVDARAGQDWRRLRMEIERHGGKWKADNGVFYEVVDGVIYQSLTEDGVTQVLVTALDAEIPYVASLDMDLQGTPPDKRRAMISELNQEVSRAAAPTEIIVIVEKDWLSKLSRARWGTIRWERHLRPTKMTLDSRKARGRAFDPNLIYPGDTFEVIA